MLVKALRVLGVPLLAIAIAVTLLALSSGETTKAQWTGSPQFQPEFDVLLCNELATNFSGPAVLQGAGDRDPNTLPACPAAEGPAATGAVRDLSNPFIVPYGHMNYDQFVWIATGGASETRGGPTGTGGNADGTGAPGGGLESTIALGLAANPCNNTIVPDFIWWEAETDWNDSVVCQGEGTSDRWATFDGGASPTTDGGDAYPGQADADTSIVQHTTTCGAALFDPDGDGIDTDGNPATIGDQPAPLHWRGAGLTQVPPGGDWQMLQNFEFVASDLADAFKANPNTTNHPYAKIQTDGFANVVILNDPTTVVLQPNPISDFCTSLAVNGMIKGTINGVNRITQPGVAGSYMAQMRTQSYRDVDGDGFENGFDSCVWAANTDDGYTTAGADTDMLDPVCDPHPAAKDDDEDGDGYLNNQDYCPLIPNPLPAGETDAESAQPYNTANADGGPRQDQIGDDCDDEMGGDDLTSQGLYILAIHTDSVCVGGTDADVDGWCSTEDPDDGDANNPGHAGAFYTGQLNHVEMDSAGIAYSPSLDSDGDGFSNLDEYNSIGTDPVADCAGFDGIHDAWPADFDMNRVINITDVFKVLPPVFGSSTGGANFSARADLAPNGVINITDVFKVLPPVFGSSCTFP